MTGPAGDRSGALGAAGFLGAAPRGYKLAVLAALLLNVVLWLAAGPVVTAWLIVLEFIATLALALKCYPLAPGGLLALQAVVLGLTTPEQVYGETGEGLPILLLLIFMVSAIAFLRELLVWIFARALTQLRSQTALALLFCGSAALLSAFLDALTVVAVVMAVATGFYRLCAELEPALDEADLEQFRAALRGLLMHAAVGTALGGVCTLVGEPQNLLIARTLGWNFAQFAREVLPVSAPVLLAGLLTCAAVEKLRLFGFGVAIPATVRDVLVQDARAATLRRTATGRWQLWLQALAAVLLVVALALHWAEVGLIGLAAMILLTAVLGVSDEHRIGEAMKSALPFTALLVVFFAIVAVIHDQRLFEPVVALVLTQHGRAQTAWMYLANGLLSAISDNVFVASVYIKQLKTAFDAGLIEPAQYARLAVAVNAGTNIPSIATPNGQAAFLFLLTSALAPLLKLSYGRMCWMALPYFVVTTLTGLLAVSYLLH
jgi:NhaB family Na+:H+ antiporter